MRGAVNTVIYQVTGYASFLAKCTDIQINLSVGIIPDITADITFGHDFLNTYGVIIDYTAHIIYLGKRKRVRVACCDSNRGKGSKIPTYCEDDLHMGPLNNEEKKKLKDMLDSFPEVITDKLGYTTTVKHTIHCKDNAPIKQRPYPVNPDKRKFIINKISEMESQGLIEPSTSGWASPIVLPRKKNGEYRLCVDFWKLNNQTTLDAYPMPDLRDMLKQVNGSRIFSTLDPNSGY